MAFYAAFNSISVISRRELTLFMLSWVSPVLGYGSKKNTELYVEVLKHISFMSIVINVLRVLTYRHNSSQSE